MSEEQERYMQLLSLLNYLRAGKEMNKLGKGRFFAVCATDMEHLVPYFRTFILTPDEVDAMPPIPMKYEPFPLSA
jgi:hypothetical protein